MMLSLYADFPAQFDTGTPLLVTIDRPRSAALPRALERRGTSGAVAFIRRFRSPSAELRSSSGLNSVSNATRTKTTNSTWKT
ncbi:MAG: hypothetical protein ACLUQ6_11690 [Alistipes onderdonkii]